MDWHDVAKSVLGNVVIETTVEVAGTMTVGASMLASAVTAQIITQYNAMQVGFAGYLLAGGYYWNRPENLLVCSRGVHKKIHDRMGYLYAQEHSGHLDIDMLLAGISS